MQRRRWLNVLLISWLWGLFGLTLLGQAASATTAPQPASAAPSSVLGLNLSGGFTQQPIDSNQIAGQSVTLVATGTRSALEAVTNPLGSRKYVWWESTDGGQTYQQVGTNSSSYQFTAPTVTSATTLMFQVQYKFSGLGSFSDYWSRVAQVTVEPSRVAATGLKVSADATSLNNGESTMVHASLTPANATDTVTWKSSDDALATVDDYGNVTATAAATSTSGTADDHGVVTITGTVNGYSDHVDITIGALQNVTVVEGTAATFTLANLPSGMTVSNWYRVKNGQSTALNSTATSYTIAKPTNADDDGTAYYAALNYTVNGKVQTVTTDAALLTVTKGGNLTLTAVPNLDFGTVGFAQLAHGTQLTIDTSSQATGTAADGNADGKLAVSDQRTVGNAWTLSASLAPFGTSDNGGSSLSTPQLALIDTSAGLNQEISANNSSTTIATQSGYHSQTYDVTASQLTLAASPLASAGDYHSIITWTLGVVPSN
ncbi:WxL domain-containing protein [Lactiplantibacillus daowaiensis]|uniref:WxL domain-containing protein n=1 Tax=Lactiplantibacillus daowaiensis TaxID=2559918 RepID=A0ABW1RY79_9LACO|nr:WxL domain-containing protein [Lactiplantibacillus daowaiensis]